MWENLLIVVFTAAATFSLSILKRNLVSPERKLDYRFHELALSDATFERCMAHLLGPSLVDGNRIHGIIEWRRDFSRDAGRHPVNAGDDHV